MAVFGLGDSVSYADNFAGMQCLDLLRSSLPFFGHSFFMLPMNVPANFLQCLVRIICYVKNHSALVSKLLI